MAIFDDFEPGDEIGWGEESVVYETSKRGDSSQELALKIRRVVDESQGAELLQAAVDQQKTSKGGCRWIVNIAACEMIAGEMMHVSPRYPRSLQTLIEGKVAVHAEGMLHLAETVLEALRDLQAKFGRAHGNLKSSNILLVGTAQLRESGIFLTDFAPAKQAYTGNDLQALGRILFSLVRKREVVQYDFPLALTADWKTLGALGGAWLKFTNVLLDPSLGSKSDALMIAEKAFAQLQKRHGGLTSMMPLLKGAGVGAAVLAVAGGLGYGIWKAAHQKHVDEVVHQATSSPDAWFGNLALELGAKPKWVSEDPYINEQVVKPVRALNLKDADAMVFRQGAIPADANSRVQAAAAVLPDVRKSLDDWGTRQAVRNSFSKFRQLGWSFPARSLEHVGETISSDRPVLEQIQDIVRSSKLIAEIEAKWQQLQTLSNSLQNTGDPVLQGGLMFAAAEAGRGQNLDDLKARLDTVSKRLQDDLQLFSRVDQARLKSDGNLPDPRGEITAANLEDWERQARRFQSAKDQAAKLRATFKARFSDLEAKSARVRRADSAAWQENLRKLQRDTDDSLAHLITSEVDDVTSRTNQAADTLEQQISSGAAPLASNPRTVPPPDAPLAMTTPPPMTVPNTAPAPNPDVQDRQAWAQIVSAARNTDLTSATPEQAKAVRDNIVSSVYRQTSPAFQGRLGSFLANLNGLTFVESAGPATAPKLSGWEGPAAMPGGAAYRFGSYTMEFVLIPADGENPAFYLSRFETPAGLVVDWVNNRAGGGWAALGFRTSTVNGPRVWAPAGAGIAVRTDTAAWAWPTSLTNQLPFYAAPPNPPPGPFMPMNYVSANSAAAIAASMGMRLPTAEEWQRPFRLQMRNLESPLRNLRDATWDDQRKYIAKSVNDLKAKGTELPDPPWPDGDIFLPSGVSVPRRGAAQPAVEVPDKTLWFLPVTQGDPGRLLNMVGNVAEFVADTSGGGPPRFSVMGGSALSPREVDPGTPYALSSAQRLTSYSDVGFRLALSPGGSASNGRRDIVALQQLLTNAPALDSGGLR